MGRGGRDTHNNIISPSIYQDHREFRLVAVRAGPFRAVKSPIALKKKKKKKKEAIRNSNI